MSAIVDRGASLTEQLLAFSRRQDLRPTPLRVDQLVLESLELMRRTLGEAITIDTQFEDDIWRATVDRHQLENAILNLAINGRDAMPRGGRLTIRGYNVEIRGDRKTKSVDLPAGHYVALCIQDTGQGIPQNVIDRVFDPFFTTKDVGAGSGLGLSMVYGFAQQSGGNVEIDSVEGAGTMVTLYLPGSTNEEVNQNIQQRTEPARGNGERIMVIEDDLAVREATAAALKSLGYEVVDGGDGTDALNIAAGQEQDIDILLTDVVLPHGLTGPELAHQISQRSTNTQILLMTGYADSHVLRGNDDERNYPLIKKPFEVGELSKTIEKMLSERPVDPTATIG